MNILIYIQQLQLYKTEALNTSFEKTTDNLNSYRTSSNLPLFRDFSIELIMLALCIASSILTGKSI